MADLYLRIADKYTGIRRIEVCANRVAPESYVQYSLFDDPKQTDKERHLQEAVLNVKQRYGKNAIMRGSNLTFDEASYLAKVSRSMINKWADKGKFTVIKVGSRVRIRRDEFEDWMEQRDLERSMQ